MGSTILDKDITKLDSNEMHNYHILDHTVASDMIASKNITTLMF